jgi:hypothetical protein
MGHRPKSVGLESTADLARKMEILEREMAAQREALDRLKQIGTQRSRESNGDQPSKRQA